MADEKGRANLPTSERVSLPGPRSTVVVEGPASAARVTAPPETMSNRELLAHIAESATALVKKQVDLARTEIQADVKRELAMVKGLGVGGLCALLALNMMLVACAFALATVLPGWAAALIVAAVVLAIGTIAGLVGWGKRVKQPLSATRRTLKEDATWAKERLA